MTALTSKKGSCNVLAVKQINDITASMNTKRAKKPTHIDGIEV